MISEEQIPPVLLLTYRRADTTARVIEALRKVKAPRIFFAADAPKPGEEEACQTVRDLVSTIDWPCEILTRFREKNSGLRDAVESSISWFFEQVESGIILEDDCVPNSDFFPFCGELLERYRDDDQINHISGNNHDLSTIPSSYRFSRYPHIWGWATWAKAWQSYSESNSLKREDLKTVLAERFPNLAEREYWLLLHDCVSSGKIDTWDFPWLFNLLTNDSLCVTPAQNLVTNIGFGEAASHTTQETSPHANRESHSIAFPLSHPVDKSADLNRDSEVADNLFAISKSAKTAHAKLRLTKLLPVSVKKWLRQQLVK